MVKRVGRSGAALLHALVGLGLLPVASWAADPVGKVSLSAQLGFASFRMSDVNAAMDRSNIVVQEAPANWETPGRLNHGFDFMSEANYDLTRDIRVGLNYGKTTGTTKKDFLQIISVKSEATTIVPRAFYRLPWRPFIDMSLRAFGGPMFVRNARIEVQHEDTDKSRPRLESLTIKGTGVGVTGGIAGEYTVSDRVTLGFEGGYRLAKAKANSSFYTISKISDPKGDDDGDYLPNDRDLRVDSYLWGFMAGFSGDQEPSIRKTEADFSGVDLRVALRLYIF